MSASPAPSVQVRHPWDEAPKTISPFTPAPKLHRVPQNTPTGKLATFSCHPCQKQDQWSFLTLDPEKSICPFMTSFHTSKKLPQEKLVTWKYSSDLDLIFTKASCCCLQKGLVLLSTSNSFALLNHFPRRLNGFSAFAWKLTTLSQC